MEINKFIKKVIDDVEKSVGKDVEIKFNLNLENLNKDDVRVSFQVDSQPNIEFKVNPVDLD